MAPTPAPLPTPSPPAQPATATGYRLPPLRSSLGFKAWSTVACLSVAALLAVGFFLFVAAVISTEMFMGREARSLPSVTGKVVSAVPVPWSTSKGKPTQTIEVTYEYVVDGKAYQDTAMGVHTWFTTNTDELAKAVAMFPSGKELRVYYSPSEPSQGWAEPRMTRQQMSFAFMGACPFVALAGLFLLNTPLKRKWNDPRVPATAVYTDGVWRIRPVLSVLRVGLGGGSLASLIIVFKLNPDQPATVLEPVSDAAVFGAAAIGFALAALVLGLGLWLGRPGRYELVVDLKSRRVTVPRRHRKNLAGEHPIAFERILAIDPVRYPENQLIIGDAEKLTTFAPVMTIVGAGKDGSDLELRLDNLVRKRPEQLTLCAFLMSLIDPRFAGHQAQSSSDFKIMTYEESLRSNT